MTEIEARVADLINFSSNQKPIDFEDAFRSILQTKVADAIETRKIEIAKSMFNPSVEQDESEEDTEEYTEEEEEENAEAA